MRRVALLLALLLIFSIPFRGVSLPSNVGSITRLVGFVAFAAWLATVLLSGRLRKVAVIHLLMACFTAWLGLSVLWSIAPGVTLIKLFTYLQIGLMVALIWDIFETRDELLWTLAAFLGGCFAVVLLTLRNYTLGRIFISSRQTRFTALVGFDPNTLGVMMVLGIPIAWWLGQNLNESAHRRWLQPLVYFYIPLATFGAMLTASRTALITLMVAYAFMLVASTGLRWTTRIAMFLLLFGAVLVTVRFVPATSLQRLGEIDESISSGDLTGRVEIWKEGTAIFLANPVFGIGGGAASRAISTGQAAHNLVIAVAAETGIVGLLFYGSIIALVVRNALRHRGVERLFWLAMIGIWAIAASTLNWESHKQTWLLFVLVSVSARIGAGETLRSAALPGRQLHQSLRRSQVARVSP